MTDCRTAFWRIAILFSFMSVFALACATEEPVATKYKRGQPGSNSNGTVGIPSSNNPGIDDLGASDDLASDDEETEDDVAEEEETPGTPAAAPPPDPAQVQAQLVQQGTQIYNQRCAGCHLDLANTQKPNRTAAAILNAAANVNHMNVTWPNQQEADALQAALAR
ncbi:MAG: hypothetical protein ACOH5I_22825 [Oligoflexus sp.]